MERANSACKIQAMINHPIDDAFKRIINSGSLNNYIVKTKDISTGHAIFCPNWARLSGRIVRQRPERVDLEYVQIPQDFYELHKFVLLVVDVILVNDIPFLVISPDI